MTRLVFRLLGQALSGKNHLQTTRYGRRYPTKAFAAWRDDMVIQLRQQHREARAQGVLPLRGPVALTAVFHHGDHRVRDLPGLLDALCHVLERATVVADDGQIHAATLMTGYSCQAEVRFTLT